MLILYVQWNLFGFNQPIVFREVQLRFVLQQQRDEVRDETINSSYEKNL